MPIPDCRKGETAPAVVLDDDGRPSEGHAGTLGRQNGDGVEQPLDNHQTRLRDRYRTLDESELPPAYRR